MKRFITSILFILAILTHSPLFADAYKVICDTNTSALDQQFAEHWSDQKPAGQWWSSWAKKYMSGKLFTGGMRTNADIKPIFKNPQLTFKTAAVSMGDEGTILSCIYQIGNPNMYDTDRGLVMFVRVNDFCHVISSNTMVCENMIKN